MAAAIRQLSYSYPNAPAMTNEDYGRATIFSGTGTLFHLNGSLHQMTFFEPNGRIDLAPRPVTLRQWLLGRGCNILRSPKVHDGHVVQMHTPEISNILREMIHSMEKMHSSGFVTVADLSLDDYIMVSGIPKLTVGIQHFSVEQRLTGRTQMQQIAIDYNRFASIVNNMFNLPNVNLPNVKDVYNLVQLLQDPVDSGRTYVLQRHAALLSVDQRLDFWRRITGSRVQYLVSGVLESIVSNKFPNWWTRIPTGSIFEEFLYYGSKKLPKGKVVPDNTIRGVARENFMTCQRTGSGLIRFIRNLVVHVYDKGHRRAKDWFFIDEWISTVFPGLMSTIQNGMRFPLLLKSIQS